jgi:flagellin
MAFRIQNNITALNALRNLQVSDTALSKSLERLSTGYRINSAKDDAAGLAISQSFRGNIAAVKVSQRNIAEANSMLQVADGAMSSIGDILTRMKELATQAASANAAHDISKISDEYDTLFDEIDRIASATKYAGASLLNGAMAGKTGTLGGAGSVDNVYDVQVDGAANGAWAITNTAGALTLTLGGVSQTVTVGDGAQTVNFDQLGVSFKTTDAAVGATVATALTALGTLTVADSASPTEFQVGYETNGFSRISVSISSLTTTDLSLAAKASITDAASARTALDTITAGIDTISSARAGVGASQNRLGYAASNLSITLENFTASESTIRDVDMASEMTTFTKNQIMLQAGTAMLAQANQAPQQLLSLFQ